MDDFINAISNAGLTPPSTVIGDGKLHRFAANGDARKKNGWYICYDDDLPTGVVGDWSKPGFKLVWTAKATRDMDPAERARQEARKAARKAIFEAEASRVHAECREKSQAIWNQSSPPPEDHPYLVRKLITPGPARLYRSSLVVPVHDSAGHIHGLQFIAPDGEKKFKIGTDYMGKCCLIGKPNGTVIVCEGYATGMTLHQATGYAVAVAFTAGNLQSVARLIRKKRQDRIIVVAADNDQWTAAGNAGLKYAREAVKAVNGVLAYPEGLTEPGTDFNDLHAQQGIDAVSAVIRAALTTETPEPAPVEEPGPEPDPSELPTPEPPPAKLTPRQTTDNLIKALNDTHFVAAEGGKTYVFSEHWDAGMGRNLLYRSSFKDFENFHLNRMVHSHFNAKGEEVQRNLGRVWLESDERRQFDGVILEPDVVRDGYYNLWRGLSVTPKPGDWSRMKNHIFENICRSDVRLYDYVIGWLATAVQHPGRPAETALVMRGKRGTGKGMLGKYFCRIFGGNSAHISNSKYLTGNFNSHLRDVVFLFADEAFWAGDKSGESVLKCLITEPTLTIEGKGRDVVFVRNMLHIMMASNNDWVVPAGLEERRFCVLDVADTYMQDQTYFGALMQQMDNGGLEAMLSDLEEYDLSGYEIRDVPQTEGLLEQKLQSLDPFMAWWFVRLSEGELLPGEGWERASARKLYESYLGDLAERYIHHRATATMFGIALRKAIPFRAGFRKLEASDSYGKREYVYHFPPLELCRGHFEAAIKSEIAWE